MAFFSLELVQTKPSTDPTDALIISRRRTEGEGGGGKQGRGERNKGG